MPTTHAPAPALVVVAAPPDVAAAIIDRSLRTWPDALVTDVSSVKETVLEGERVLARPEDLPRYIGSHPMAGREISGVIAARGDLFMGRPLDRRSEEHTSELQSRGHLVCRLLLQKKKTRTRARHLQTPIPTGSRV